ncbi:MAG: hypothetical protein ACQEWG_11110 [Bacteroidota bacterium]
MNFLKILKKHYNFLRKRRMDYLQIKKVRREIKFKNKINVGAGDIEFDSSWFSCDKNKLNITKEKDWKHLLGSTRVKNIFAEHVWEHLTKEETFLANLNCYKYLKKGGRLRLAVPDGFHPDKNYIEYVKPNGTGIGSDDHRILYNYILLSEKLKEHGFKIDLLEYWDENGKFHFNEWDNEDGKVRRSKRYDSRNINGKLNYTSLIIDAIK